MNREEIIRGVKEAARMNGGKALGQTRFTQLTGIQSQTWLKYWSRFGDMVKEAGLEPNKLNAAYGDTYLLEKLICLSRELGKFPTANERRTKALNDPTFPSNSTFDRLGGKRQVALKIEKYCRERGNYNDVMEIVAPHLSGPSTLEEAGEETTSFGFVYLVKGHPGEYKIGRTNIVDRRLSELGVSASIEQQLIHEIKTDDPVGVELYWHNRFQEKRMRGEWFKLTSSDVRLFKRWKRIY